MEEMVIREVRGGCLKKLGRALKCGVSASAL